MKLLNLFKKIEEPKKQIICPQCLEKMIIEKRDGADIFVCIKCKINLVNKDALKKILKHSK